MKLTMRESARLKEIEEWVLAEKLANITYRPLRHRIVSVWNLIFGVVAKPVDADDYTIPVMNCEYLLNIIKRELERDAERRRRRGE